MTSLNLPRCGKPYAERVENRRWPWWAAAACLSGSAVAAGMATYRHWEVCGESLLVGTLLQRLSPRADFSDECLRRMDGGMVFPVPDVAERVPGVAGLSVTAMVLAALAWLVVVLAMRWSSRTTTVAVVPALLTLGLAGTAIAGLGAPRSLSEPVSIWLGLAGELTAGVALIAVWAWEPGVRALTLARIMIVLWGLTSFGFFHLAADFLLMTVWSVANWDVPPGTGWMTVAGLVASGVLTAVLTLRSGPGQPETSWGHPDAGRWQSRAEVH